jgi:hypothetical protein
MFCDLESTHGCSRCLLFLSSACMVAAALPLLGMHACYRTALNLSALCDCSALKRSDHECHKHACMVREHAVSHMSAQTRRLTQHIARRKVA